MDISQAFGAYLRDHDDTGSSEAIVMFAVAFRFGKRSLETTIVAGEWETTWDGDFLRVTKP